MKALAVALCLIPAACVVAAIGWITPPQYDPTTRQRLVSALKVLGASAAITAAVVGMFLAAAILAQKS